MSQRYRATVMLWLATILLCGCTKVQVKHEDMVAIISEALILDAYTDSPIHSLKLFRKDTIDYYASIFEKYGYSEEEFVGSLQYYLNRPAQMEKLMDKVIAHLSVFEAEKKKEISIKRRELELAMLKPNYWEKADSLELKGKGRVLPFKISNQGIGLYTISAKVMVDTSDQSVDPQMQAWFLSDNERICLVEESYTKDGQERLVMIKLLLPTEGVTHFAGNIFSSENPTKEWLQNVIIKDIFIGFTPLPQPHVIGKELELTPGQLRGKQVKFGDESRGIRGAYDNVKRAEGRQEMPKE